MRGLRARLAAWAAVIALVATGLPGLWLTWRAYHAQRDQAFESQLALASSLAAEIDAELGQAVSAVEALATRPRVLSDAGRLGLRLDLVASSTDRLDDLLVVNAQGHLVERAPLVEAPPPFALAERQSLVSQALAARDQTLSIVHHEAGGRIILRLARAASSNSVVLGQLNLEAQGIGSLELLKIGSRGFAYLLEEDGQALVLPSLAKRLGPESSKDLTLSFNGKSLVQVISSATGQDLLAVSPLATVNWAVAVRRPLSEVEAGARRMRRELIIFVVIALLASGGLAVALAGPLVQRLLSLSTAARRMESGTLDPAEMENPPATDEIGLVSSALAHLARALSQQRLAREQAHARALAAERRLARSERLASLGQLAAGLAHELNSPLMVIQGAADEAMGLQPKAAKPWLQRVRNESLRCSRLVHELLDFARPRPPAWREFDLAELAREAFATAGAGRKQAYPLALQTPQPKVRGDRDQFQQVLINLFSNAMDAMPEGGPINAILKALPQGWSLSIRDQGAGVPARQRESIFRPFFTNKPGGTGLGLAISRNLVTGHGGSLRCVAVRGKGACFRVDWPASKGGKHG